MSKKKITPEVFAEVVEMIEAGVPIDTIEYETGLSQSAIYQIRKDAGFVSREEDLLDLYDTDVIAEQYKEGTKIREICKEHGLTRYKFYKILELIGVPLRQYDEFVDKAKDRQKREAIEMYKAGYKINDICREVGISQPTLHKWLHDEDVPLRRPGMSR